MEVERNFSCASCGKGTRCLRGEPLSKGLKGWLTLAYWRERGQVTHYAFCSFSCMKSWLDTAIPSIPQVFLESFGDDENS